VRTSSTQSRLCNSYSRLDITVNLLPLEKPCTTPDSAYLSSRPVKDGLPSMSSPVVSQSSQSLLLPASRNITPSPEKAVVVKHRVLAISSPQKASRNWTFVELASPKKPAAPGALSDLPTPDQHSKSISKSLVNVRKISVHCTDIQ
jgi:hypothetical protein